VRSCLQGGGPPVAGEVGEVGLVLAEHRQAFPVRVGGGWMACGGRPTSTVDGGITAPAGTSVPSPRMQPFPSRAPGIRIAPLPISQRSPTVAPMICARWPKTVR
jgi:hypothetical protein